MERPSSGKATFDADDGDAAAGTGGALPRGGVFAGKAFDARGLLRGVPSSGGTRSADASGFPRETDEDVVQRRSTGSVVDAEEAEEEEQTASAVGSQEEEDTAGPGEVARVEVDARPTATARGRDPLLTVARDFVFLWGRRGVGVILRTVARPRA